MMRLFCLPWAGGSAAAYRTWSARLGPHFSVVGVELPGRGRRFSQPLCTAMDEVIGHLMTELADDMRRGPFAIFGHSLGGMVGFQLTYELARRGLPAPARLFISAARPPHRRRQQQLHLLPDTALLAELVRLNGVPAELIEHDEFRKVLLPVIRADLSIAETWQFPVAAPLTVPVSLLSGRDDPLAAADEVARWRPYFTGDITHYGYDGGHFYPSMHRDQLLADVAKELLKAPGLAQEAARAG